MSQLYEMILLPILKEKGNAISQHRGGASDLIQAALKRGIGIKLFVSSGTSLGYGGANLSISG
jgi:hypothetical protein